jgi:hypothetical protein
MIYPGIKRAIAATQKTTYQRVDESFIDHQARFSCDGKMTFPNWSETNSTFNLIISDLK